MKAILDFWFGTLREEADYLASRNRLWFEGSPVTDTAIRAKFQADWEKAARGELDAWAAEPQGRLALILVLDQFTRHLFRGTKEAFSQDAKARALCLGGLDHFHDRLLHPIHRMFFYLPLEHAEDMALQRRSIALYARLLEEAPAPLKAGCEEALDYALQHHAIIERFGRFPHRNALLGRASTPEELAFLKEPGSSF